MERFKIVYKRGHGPGGQHKNKVETCVVVTDPETGMVETCQDTRSQSGNKALAIERLTARIRANESIAREQALNERRKECHMTGVVRTYNYPRGTVKDNRSGKTAPLKKVLNGDLNLIR